VSDEAAGAAASAQLRSVPRDARAFQGQPAGIVTRSMAGAVDALVIIVFLFGLWAGWGVVRFLAHPVRFTFPNPSAVVDAAVGCGIAVVYFTAAWATSGRTFGARLLGLRVVTRRGDRVHWGLAAVRSALCVLFPVGLLWAAVSKHTRSVQDILLGTFVIYDWRAQAPWATARSDPGPSGGDSASRAADDSPS
jgi:uncharacterized RDD family membrane protein YckC